MSWRITVGLAAFAAGALACIPPNCVNGGFGGGGTGGTQVLVEDPSHQLFFDHRLLQVVLDNLEVGQCTTPTSVQTLVEDPANNVVDNHSAINTGSKTGFAISVSFDAGAPGWYFVQSNVQPNLGLQEADVLVLQDREQPDAGVPLPFDGGCQTLDQTAGGIWVCTSEDNRTAGTPVQVLGQSARAAGASVWAFDPGHGPPALVLYGEDAGTLVQIDRLPQPSVFSVDALAANAQGVVAASGSQLLWFTQDAGHIVAAGSTVIPELQGALTLALNGSTVLAAGAPDGGSACQNISPSCPGAFTACSVAFGAGASPPTSSCLGVVGSVLGSDGAFIWSTNVASGRISAYAGDGGAVMFVASSSLSLALLTGELPSFMVKIEDPQFAIVNGTALPTVQGVDVTYAFYDPLPGQLMGASQSFVWESNPSGGVTVFPR